MKSSRRTKNEKGAVALISLGVMTVFVLLTAIVVDYGLFCYKSTKLQNAVDAAATAVCANLDATSQAQEDIARNYLTKNGFDGDSEDIEVTIERKGVLDTESINMVGDDSTYISAGYIKITVDANEGMIFSEVFNRDSMRVIRSAYAKCGVDYVDMPRALKYTLFAGSTEGTDIKSALQINGRTGDLTNFLNSKLEGFINGVNESIVQPIIGWFGGETDYTDLVHFNLSEAITDGDVHSNSTISVGVQALNASRTKDGNLTVVKTDANGNPVVKTDENGNAVTTTQEQVVTDENGEPVKKLDENGEPITDIDGNFVYETTTVTVPVYVYESENGNTDTGEHDDYGQVTYTSVGSISFTNNSGDSTRVYVQNQQYLEQTQAVLNVLNQIDYSKVSSLATLKAEYNEKVEDYLNAKTYLTSAQAQLIKDQVNNLGYNEETKVITLSNQSMIVYQSTHDNAKIMLDTVYSQASPLDYVYAELISNGNDRVDIPAYSGVVDSLPKGTINYSVTISPIKSDNNIEVQIAGSEANRNFLRTGMSSYTTDNATATGLKYALTRTFQENLGENGYIPTPNMKPYFVREVNRSIRNSTQTEAQLGDAQSTGDSTVKEAVANMTGDLVEILNETEYTDNTYSSSASLKNADTTPLFKYYKESSTSGLTELTGTDSTTYKGFKLYNSNNVLKTPDEFVEEYKSTITNNGTVGKSAVEKYYNTKVKDNDTSYETKYADDKVSWKRDNISVDGSLSNGYSEKQNNVNSNSFSATAPSPYDVFLGGSSLIGGIVNAPRRNFNDAVSDIENVNISNLISSNGLVSASSQTFFPVLDSSNYSAQMQDGYTFGNGSTTQTFSNAGSYSSKGKKVISSNSWFSSFKNVKGTLGSQNGPVEVNAGVSMVVTGNFTSETTGKTVNIGYDSNGKATLIVGGNISCHYNLEIRPNSAIYCQNTVTMVESSDILYIFENGKLYCRELNANIQKGDSCNGAYIYCAGNINGSVTLGDNATVICLGNITGSVSVGNNSTVICNGCIGGSVSCGENSKVYVVNYIGGAISAGNGSLVAADNYINCSSITLSGNAQVITDGVITISGSVSGTTDNKIICAGFTQSGDSAGEFLNCVSILTTGDFTCSSYLTNRGIIKCMGNLTISGAVANKNWAGTVTSYGFSLFTDSGSQMYVKGNVTTTYGMRNDRSIIYICGNFSATDFSKSYSGNLMEIQTDNVIYIRGTASCAKTTSHIWLKPDSTGTFLSIYGYGTSSNCFLSTVEAFANEQAGSTVYLGVGVAEPKTLLGKGYLSDDYNLYLSASSGGLMNYGTMYVYCNMQINSSTADLKGSGKTYIAGNMYAPNAEISVTEGHTYVCDGNTTCKSVKASTSTAGTKKSCIWVIGKLTATGGITVDSVEANNISEIFGGPGSAVANSIELNLNGYLYLPASSNDCVLTRLNVGQFGRFIFNGNTLTVTSSFTVAEGGLLYVKGKTNVSCVVTNNGNMYLMGGIDMSASNATDTTCDLALGDNSDTFIGTNATDGSIGTLDIKGYYMGKGTVYIENNLVINGCYEKSSEYVANRCESLIITSGNTYVSGDITFNNRTRSLYVANGTSLSCNNLTLSGAIYNLGTLVVLDNLTLRCEQGDEFSDKKEYDTVANLKKGYTIRNGVDKNNNMYADAFMYVGSENQVTLGGSFQNAGTYVQNGPMSIQGYHESSSEADGSDAAFINQNNAVAHFGGGVNTNSNAISNTAGASFSCEGDLNYGIVLLNCGSFNVTGDIYQNRNSVNSWSWRSGNSMSIMNGFASIRGTEYPSSTLYCGGTIQLGLTEVGGEAGSVFNMGTLYVTDDLNVYCNKGHSYFVTAIWNYNNANTFIGGDCFGGGGIATGSDTIFMVGDDYRSKRSTKINCKMFGYNTIDAGNFYTYSDEDTYSKAYFYVGGNMISNVLGGSVRASTFPTTVVPENNSRDLDIYSNTNMYVGGSLYANSKLYMKQNVTMLVAGEKSLYDENKQPLEILFDTDTVSLKQAVTSLMNGTNYKIFVYQCLDENICSRIVCNGSMFVKDTSKIRDMTKNWIYGDFKCNNYVEIGKSLYDDNRDESMATADPYKKAGETKSKYVFSNAGVMNVSGNFSSGKYTKVYASTTLRVGGDFVSSGYLTLRHDAKIYVGKKLKAATSIDGGSYSEFHVAGSMQASSSFIKLRDAVTCVVGGNMTALSYIELGKSGDYTRKVTTNADGSKTVTESDIHGVTEGTEDKYEGSSGETVGENSGSGTGAAEDIVAGEEIIVDTETIETAKELSNDESDKAVGGEFYIGKVLASYTSYIKEFAYSRVAVGNYVFTPKYLTLRHNCDMWVMPETFENETFVAKSYVPQSDGTFWGDVKDRINELAFNVSQTFTPKNGSIYTLGELTLNKNASLMGTYDCVVQGQCVLRQDSLVYIGNDFNVTAKSINVTLDSLTGNTSLCGFDTYGTAAQTYKLQCPHIEDHHGKSEGKYYTSYVLASSYDPAKTYTCQLCGREIESKYISEKQQSYPVVIYADNSINILTTIDMKLTYLVANRGDVNLYDVYSNSENAANNATQLPNAICSYNGDINFFSMYGKIGALFYCPNGNLDIDGYYVELWGSGIGDTVTVNTYYLALHRFTNWRTMKLDMAESGSVYLISENEYERQVENIDDIYMYDPSSSDNTGGASLFFDLKKEDEG